LVDDENPTPGRWNQVLKALIAVGLLFVASSSSFAEEQLVPNWMTVDAGAQVVTMDVVAGFNPNQDGDVPHSLVVMADPGEDDLPLQAGRERAAFARAYSKSPEQGISAGDRDTISFTADETGDFLWFCGVPGHGQSGMWIRFKVVNGAETPYITIAAGAEPGRP
jgi:hypothetical protein